MGRLRDRIMRNRYRVYQPQQPQYTGEEEDIVEDEYGYKPELDDQYHQYQGQGLQDINNYTPQNNYDVQYQENETEINTYDNPLAILDEIKKQPSPKGTIPIMIGGRPLDLHVLEDYVVKVSPYHLRTILRYHNARTIEEIKNYSQRFGMTRMKGSTILIILLAVGMAVLGLIMMMYMPQIIGMFTGGL